MLSLVADWRSSGLTQKAFCELHHLKVATLGYWVARSKEKDMQSSGFIELSGRSLSQETHIEIIYPTGVRLKVGHDLGLIAQLIRL